MSTNQAALTSPLLQKLGHHSSHVGGSHGGAVHQEVGLLVVTMSAVCAGGQDVRSGGDNVHTPPKVGEVAELVESVTCCDRDSLKKEKFQGEEKARLTILKSKCSPFFHPTFFSY